MKVKDYMTSELITVDYYDSIIDAAKLMKKHNIGCIPVKNTGKIIGVLTDRDIVVKGLAIQSDFNNIICGDIATQAIISVDEVEDAAVALNYMSEHKIRRLLVTKDGNVTGIISIGDIASSEYPDEHVGKVLSKISEK